MLGVLSHSLIQQTHVVLRARVKQLAPTPPLWKAGTTWEADVPLIPVSPTLSVGLWGSRCEPHFFR